MNCVMCNKKLVLIGTSRKNGVKHHKDWNNRKYHKQCWKSKKEPESVYLKGFRELQKEISEFNLKIKYNSLLE